MMRMSALLALDQAAYDVLLIAALQSRQTCNQADSALALSASR